MTQDLKPYPAYKDSGVAWIGRVPEHWVSSQIRRHCRVFEGATPSRAVPAYWINGTIPWLSSGDVNRRRIRSASQSITQAGFAASSTKWINPRSLVVALAGQGRTKGMVATVEIRTTCNQSLAVVEPKAHAWDYRFLAYYLDSLYLEIRGLVGDDLRDGLNLEHIRSISAPMPPLPEQSAIVRFLDHHDRLIRRYIRSKRRLIALLNEQKQAIIHRAVTRGLDPNVRFKPSGVEWLGDVPEHWQVAPAKYFYREVDERSSTGAEELLSVSHLTGVTPRSEKNVTMFLAESPIGSKICRPNDLVINTMWAWMGALGIARQVGIVSPSYAVYRPVRSDGLLPDYADALLRTRPYVAEYICRSSGIRPSRLRLYPEKFLRIPVVQPPEGEQRRILSYLDMATFSLNTALQRTSEEIEIIREYRTRLIADVVTGKFDVREAAADLPEEPEETEPIDEAEELAEGELEGEEAELEVETAEIRA